MAVGSLFRCEGPDGKGFTHPAVLVVLTNYVSHIIYQVLEGTSPSIAHRESHTLRT